MTFVNNDGVDGEEIKATAKEIANTIANEVQSLASEIITPLESPTQPTDTKITGEMMLEYMDANQQDDFTIHTTDGKEVTLSRAQFKERLRKKKEEKAEKARLEAEKQAKIAQEKAEREERERQRVAAGLAKLAELEATRDTVQPDINLLIDMMGYMRPHYTVTEQDWIDTFILGPCLDLEFKGFLPLNSVDSDTFGNVIICTDKNSKTLFSAHTDTVHKAEGRQTVCTSHTEEGYIAFKSDGQPLGADDAVGCFILLHLIKNKVPGTYIFHRGEERGGKGSSYIEKHHSDFLAEFDRAIAFDRKGTGSIITEQGSLCASDTFAQALADQLDSFGGDFFPDDTGVFTDTANYTDVIAECTNISCGYYSEHTAREYVDLNFVEWLCRACVLVDWENLPTERKPGDYGSSFNSRYGYNYRSYEYDYGNYRSTKSTTLPAGSVSYSTHNNRQYVKGSDGLWYYEGEDGEWVLWDGSEEDQLQSTNTGDWEPWDDDYYQQRYGSSPFTPSTRKAKKKNVLFRDYIEEPDWMDYDEVENFVLKNPAEVAEILQDIALNWDLG